MAKSIRNEPLAFMGGGIALPPAERGAAAAAATPPPAEKLRVFISYSREDLGFADQIEAALKLTGFEPVIDRHGISGGEEWKRRLANLIRDADTIAFVLSPQSAHSEICAWEVDEAIRLNKRVLPLVCRSLADSKPPPALADLNYIYFFDDPKASPGQGFGTGLARLVDSLKTDLDWLRRHTRLQQRAGEWDEGGRLPDRLLSGDDIQQAKDWLARRPATAPEATALHLAFIRASEDEAASRLIAERRRFEEMAAAQDAREKALKDAEAALLQAADARRRRAVLRNVLVVLSTFTALISGGAGLAIWGQLEKSRADGARLKLETAKAQGAEIDSKKSAQKAVVAAGVARDARRLAEKERDAAKAAQRSDMRSQAQRLAVLADLDPTRRGPPSPTEAVLYALEALPDAKSRDLAVQTRELHLPAETRLAEALLVLQERRILAGHTGSVRSVAGTRDGRFIVSGSDDGTLGIWDASKGVRLHEFKSIGSRVTGVAISSDGGRVVTISAQTIRVWDMEKGVELKSFTAHSRRITSVVMTRDGGRIITGSVDHTIGIWHAETGAEVRILKGHDEIVVSLALTADGRYIVSGANDDTIRIWDVEKPETEPRVLKGHTDNVNGVAVTSDGVSIVSGSQDGTIRIWELATGREVRVLNGHVGPVNSVAVTSDGERIVSAGDDGTLRIWDLKAGRELRVMRGHKSPVRTVALIDEDRRIVTGSDDGTVRVWHIETEAGRLPILQHDNGVQSVAITSDDRRIVTGGEDQIIRIWDVATGKAPKEIKGHTGAVTSLALSEAHGSTPDGENRRAVGRRIVSGSADDTVRVWDLETGAQIKVLNGHSDTVRSVAISLDGRWIVSGADDNTARIWSADTFELVHKLEGHTGTVMSVAVSKDGRVVVTGSFDDTIRI